MRWYAALMGSACLGAGGTAVAMPLNLSPDWNVNWDNTVQYNIGMRVKGVDDRIGNNPVYSENDYKFDSAGDIVTNRLSLLSEFDAEYRGASFGTAGLRVSGSGFRDFAYDNKVENNPGEVAPGVPYEALGSYEGNRYSSYTKRYHVRGGQLLDAFAFTNFTLGGHASSIKAGRLTSYWGNALFFGFAGINYSQNAVDNIKGASAPGTQAKELAIPRAQVLFSTDLTSDLALTAQYFLEFQGNRLPQGGTYLGITGFLFNDTDYLLGPGGVPRGDNFRPDEINSNFGLRMTWSPAWLSGVLGLHYRRLDETQPWVPLFGADSQGNPNFHLAYAENVDLIGLSLDKQLGALSTGFEVSYRHNTGLNSVPGPLPSDLDGREGARGDTLNVLANVLFGLTPTPLWQTGSALGEVVYTRKLDVTANEALYNGTDNASACPSGNKWNGCATDDAVSVAALFTPQWLQVFPGIDLDMPIFAMYGVYGNAASLGGPVNQGAFNYTVGLHTLIRARYNVTLQYNGYSAHTNGGLTNFPTANGTPVPIGTPGFPSYYASGNGTYFYNDKDWLSLTVQFAF
jgi:hypothetical protein